MEVAPVKLDVPHVMDMDSSTCIKDDDWIECPADSCVDHKSKNLTILLHLFTLIFWMVELMLRCWLCKRFYQLVKNRFFVAQSEFHMFSTFECEKAVKFTEYSCFSSKYSMVVQLTAQCSSWYD